MYIPGMTLKEYLSIKGNTATALGKKVGVSHASILRYANNKQPISGDRAVDIERETDGQVTRQELRPDLWPAEAA